MTLKAVVIGSGAAGTACAMALLDAGADVVMVDGGVSLEQDRADAVAALRAHPPEEWSENALDFLNDGISTSLKGILLKRAYGSAYPYEDPVGHPIQLRGAQSSPSYGRGGLSAVWGAAALPYRDADIDVWPVSRSDLDEHYRAVLEFVPLSGDQSDPLAELFPTFTPDIGALPVSAQALEILHRKPSQQGFWIGRSRLAVAARSSAATAGCVKCGLCLLGCPYGLIYNTMVTVHSLRDNPRFSYRPGVVVESVREADGKVTVTGTDLGSHSTVQLTGDKVFVGAGVLGSARILLGSMEAYGVPRPLQDSCYFLLPLMRYRAAPHALEERAHTLSQLFIEILDASVSPRTVHLQLYTYNRLMREAVRNLSRHADRFIGDVVDRHVLSRVVLLQGYLHSDESPGATVTLNRGEPGAPAQLQVEGATDLVRTRAVLSRLQRRLWKEQRTLGAVPMSPFLKVGEPGRGFHSGGTFPMKRCPGELETDRLGRLGGVGNIHVVDSSVFPSVPASTITLTVMANAHRIAQEAAAS